MPALTDSSSKLARSSSGLLRPKTPPSSCRLGQGAWKKACSMGPLFRCMNGPSIGGEDNRTSPRSPVLGPGPL
eukprot:9932026-Alexandrium_andersonii.AAC.1